MHSPVEPHLACTQGAPLLLWRFDEPVNVVSSAAYGGGLGQRSWLLNATVRPYYEGDPCAHVGALAGELGCRGAGAGLLTAVDVREAVTVTEGPVTVTVTTGVGQPCYAAEFEYPAAAVGVGTINVVGGVGVPLAEGGMVNAVATVAEAKAQALADAGVPGTGTCTDATALYCPPGEAVQSYGGPRSALGAPLARAVYQAVRTGLDA